MPADRESGKMPGSVLGQSGSDNDVKASAEVPPVPSGRPAVDAWKSLDRAARRRLLRGEPDPDPAKAVIAVGYARMVLSRSPLRRGLPIASALVIICVVVAVVVAVADTVAPPSRGRDISLFVTIPGIIVAVAIAMYGRRRTVALIRMEYANASRLWATETVAGAEDVEPSAPSSPRASPQRAVATGSPTAVGAGPVAFRYSARAVLRLYTQLAAILVACTAVIWLLPSVRPIAVVVTILMAMVVGYLAYQFVRRVRPWEPLAVLNAEGIAFPREGVRVAWPEITEIRVSPIRGAGARTARHRVVAFLVADPEAVVTRFRSFAQRRGRRSLSLYGTPISLTDYLLVRSAEDIVTAALGFASVPYTASTDRHAAG